MHEQPWYGELLLLRVRVLVLLFLLYLALLSTIAHRHNCEFILTSASGPSCASRRWRAHRHGRVSSITITVVIAVVAVVVVGRWSALEPDSPGVSTAFAYQAHQTRRKWSWVLLLVERALVGFACALVLQELNIVVVMKQRGLGRNISSSLALLGLLLLEPGRHHLEVVI